MTYLYSGAIVSATAFLILTLSVFRGSPTVESLDKGVEPLTLPFKTRGWSLFWSVVTFFGSVFGIAGMSLITAYLTHFSTEIIIRGAIAVGGSALIVQIVKILIARMRPEKLPGRSPEIEFSYPSGHTAAATSLYSLIAVLFSVTSPLGLLWIFPGVAAVLLIAFSRMALSVHYASDIIGGLFLGLFGLFVAFSLPIQFFSI
jgi:undecaprenyl-diphosphatase